MRSKRNRASPQFSTSPDLAQRVFVLWQTAVWRTQKMETGWQRMTVGNAAVPSRGATRPIKRLKLRRLETSRTMPPRPLMNRPGSGDVVAKVSTRDSSAQRKAAARATPERSICKFLKHPQQHIITWLSCPLLTAGIGIDIS